jgi:hypothetical protein
VDDFFAFGTSPSRLDSARLLVKDGLLAKRLVPKDKKEVPAIANASVTGGVGLSGLIYDYLGLIVSVCAAWST